MENFAKQWEKRLNYSTTAAVFFSIGLYRALSRGIFSGVVGTGNCRFFPSCSEYMLNAISQYGLLKGTVVSLKRILRCNPTNQGGYDPVTK